ncbi:MAG TPA: ATP-binding protein [Candidatus Olsenella pullistercoris]|uniref:ATP-binding protein n=1 Tax=Candidatus Olsenella pullistercoris TaxID=2838712 RepID=A0A9D2JEZ7_9ACTN|nr:ATP-binding protein [Candidatus Olsenella pullistercoris]
MPRDFYPFVEEGNGESGEGHLDVVTHPARVAVYDDAAAAPRVVVIEPKDVRSYLEEITATVSRLAREQGGSVPFMVIREIVENFIHAYFQAPTITILDGGNTIRFSDRGPGIREKALALEFGTSSATEEMKRYIRGVGSGLPYVQQYMADKGGSLDIEDNISGGTVVTISTRPVPEARAVSNAPTAPLVPGTSGSTPVAPLVPGTSGAVAGTGMPQVELDERGEAVMSYLAEHESVGPSDLVRAEGRSAASWSRTLAALAAQGLVMKVGQKYQPTAIGRTLT